MSAYQPKTGAKCGCRRGVQRDNCPNCEGTGMVIDFQAIRVRGGEDMTQPAKHAPGPWQISAIQNEPEKISIIDADMCFVAEVWQTYINGESRQQAHAALIAAAPAMYEALRMLITLDPRCHRGVTHCGECGACMGQAALAQAEARS